MSAIQELRSLARMALENPAQPRPREPQREGPEFGGIRLWHAVGQWWVECRGAWHPAPNIEGAPVDLRDVGMDHMHRVYWAESTTEVVSVVVPLETMRGLLGEALAALGAPKLQVRESLYINGGAK